MATITWVVLKHHKKADGTYNPKIRITHKRSTKYLPTSIFTPAVRFKKGASSGTITDDLILDSLNDKVKQIRSIINEYSENIEDFEDAGQVVELILSVQNRRKTNIDFIAFARNYVDGIKKEGTKKTTTIWLNMFCRYVKEVTGYEKLPIHKLNKKLLKDYEKWLSMPHYIELSNKKVRKPPLNSTSQRVYLIGLAGMFNRAKEAYNDYDIGDIVIKNDPFVNYNLPLVAVAEKRALSASIIRKIYNYQSQPRVKGRRRLKVDILARDLFIMSFVLAGMNMVDIFNCPVIGERIEYKRAKTNDRKKEGAFISLPVPREIHDIIDRYKDITNNRGFAFYRQYKNELLLTHAVNNGLKHICEAIGIPIITFYAARHSFATIARNDCDVSVDDVAFCLTHSSGHNITDMYIKPDYSRTDKVIQKVIDFVFNTEE